MSRRISSGLAVGLLTAAALVSFAGEKDYKCPYDTQICLDKLATKLTNRGWLGIEYENAPGEDYPSITRVVPGSPAESAGFREGDVLVSINGAKFADNAEGKCVTCEKMKGSWIPGNQVTYVVQRDGKEITLSATLASLPSDVMAMMIGMHMLEHVTP